MRNQAGVLMPDVNEDFVATDWKNLRSLDSPAQRCSSVDAFVVALEHSAVSPGDVESYRRYAAGFDWRRQVALLLQSLDALPARRDAA